MSIRRIAPALLVVLAANLGAQTSPASEPPMPTTGLDFSAVDQFWRMVDVLTTDAEPSEEQWRTLLTTPGYRLAQIALGEVAREDLELAFRPSRRAAFDSLTKLTNDRASRLKHLVRAASLRPQLTAFRDSLTRSAPILEAVSVAAKFLPPGATNVGEPPLVAVALFRNDGYSLGPGVIIDLLNAYEANLVLFLAHEFHHTYVGRAGSTTLPSSGDSTGRMLRAALTGLRNEGIADLIDKPYPLTWSNPVRATYVKRYNEEYARTPTTLRELDSLLAVVADDSTQMAAVGRRARTLLWSNGHANGAYIARQIYERFGVDSLFPAVANPAAFFRTYAAVERARGNAVPFSPGAMRVIESLERRYWRPTDGSRARR